MKSCKRNVKLSNIKPPSLFILPDRSTLKYAYPGEKGAQDSWFRTYDTQGVRLAATKKKEKNCRLNLWSSSTNLYILAADFDILPTGFGDFNQLEDYLRDEFSGDKAIIARSPSNKVKAFFLVKTPPEIKMNKELALSNLEMLLMCNEELYQSIDKSSSSVKITYLNTNVLTQLHSLLPKLKSNICVLSNNEGGERESLVSRTKNINPVFQSVDLSDISSLFPKDIKLPKKSNLRFLKELLKTPGLLRKSGYCLSSIKLASEVEVAQSLISRNIISYKIQYKWLIEIENGFYIPGKQAKRYRATNELEMALKTLYPNFQTQFLSIPKQIPNGKWHVELGKLVGKLYYRGQSLNAVKKVIANIEGANLKDRMKKTEDWFKWYSKKHS